VLHSEEPNRWQVVCEHHRCALLLPCAKGPWSNQFSMGYLKRARS
jgi:hypothetical protein